MKKIVFLSIFLWVSCTDEQDCCTPGNDMLYEFSLINQNSEDLLNENTLNSYNTNNIKLYDLINGEETLINNPNSDAPNGYIIFEKEGSHLIRTFFDESNLTVSGIIEWNLNERDTISLEIVQESENIKRLVKIQYNGEEVWDAETATDPDYRYFRIIK